MDIDNDLRIHTHSQIPAWLENRPGDSHLIMHCRGPRHISLQQAKILSPTLGLQIQIWSLS